MTCNGNNLARALFKSVQAGIVVVDADTKTVIDINPAACIMIGAARENVIGKPCNEFLCAENCDGCPIMTANLADGIEDVENKEIVLHRRDGSRVFALLTINSVILRERGEEKRVFINSLIDITRQKEAEERINGYWAEAERLLADNVIKLKNGVA
jgi:PAS domain S-box-containing protein